jgi:hypothetical protein
MTTIEAIQHADGYLEWDEKLLASITELERRLQRLRDMRLDHQRRNTLILCHGCGNFRPVCEYTFLRDHWYVSPRGCTDGDYWVEGDVHYAKCPCGGVTRLYPNTIALNKQSGLFKDVVEVYDGRKKGVTLTKGWINIDQVLVS